MRKQWVRTSDGVVVVAVGMLILPGRVAAAEALERTPSPPGARVYFISPADGAVGSSPVTIRFGLSVAGVAPAGVIYPKTGHHHLVIDAPTPPENQPIPNDDQHRHFGAGQTEVVLELAPGTHTLQLVLGDYVHVPHDPPVVSETITVTVE